MKKNSIKKKFGIFSQEKNIETYYCLIIIIIVILILVRFLKRKRKMAGW